MEETLEGKQQFLREQILDKGYDPTDFSNFLMSKGGEEGTDLEKWNFFDLQYVVQEYISTHGNSLSPEQQQYQMDPTQQYQQYQIDENGNYIQPQDQPPIDQGPPKPEDIYVECQRGETTEIGSHEDLVIKISE